MFGADTKSKATVRPRMIQVKATVVTAEIMSDPLAVRVNVRSLRVTRPVGTSVALLRSGMRLSSKWRWTMLRNVTAAMMFISFTFITSTLRRSPARKPQPYRQKPNSFMHVCLLGK
jgi:hypothetical protein